MKLYGVSKVSELAIGRLRVKPQSFRIQELRLVGRGGLGASIQKLNMLGSWVVGMRAQSHRRPMDQSCMRRLHTVASSTVNPLGMSGQIDRGVRERERIGSGLVLGSSNVAGHSTPFDPSQRAVGRHGLELYLSNVGSVNKIPVTQLEQGVGSANNLDTEAQFTIMPRICTSHLMQELMGAKPVVLKSNCCALNLQPHTLNSKPCGPVEA